MQDLSQLLFRQFFTFPKLRQSLCKTVQRPFRYCTTTFDKRPKTEAITLYALSKLSVTSLSPYNLSDTKLVKKLVALFQYNYLIYVGCIEFTKCMGYDSHGYNTNRPQCFVFFNLTV